MIRAFQVLQAAVVLSLATTVLAAPLSAQTMAPKGSTQSVVANAITKVTFSITNNTGMSRPFNLNPCVPSGTVTACSAPSVIFVPSPMTMNFDVTFSTGSTTGSGRIDLSIAGGGDNGWVNVTVTAGTGVAITPHAGTTGATANSSGNAASFTVQNTGTVQKTFSFTCGAMSNVSCGTTPAPVTLDAGAQTNVSMPYSSGDPGTGKVSIIATGPSATDAGTYTVSINGVDVTPDGGTAPTRTPNTGGYSEPFYVRNAATTQNTFSFSCYAVTGVTCGTVPAPVTLAGTSQTTVYMPYSVGAPGTGIFYFTASGTNSNDNGSYSVPIVSYGVAVTPDNGAAPTRTANTGGYSETFTVQNTGSANNTFTFSCTGAGGVTCGTVPASVPLSAGGQTTVSMPYSVGAPGTGTLTLTATGTSASDAGSYSVPIASYGVVVTPDGQIGQTRFANTGGYSETFAVRNSGTAGNTYSFACTATGGIVCGANPASLAIDAGVTTNVTMPYSTGTAGTGTLTLTATGTNSNDAGSFSVPVALSLSWIATGTFTVDGNFFAEETDNSYNTVGQLLQATDGRGQVTNYQYGGNSNSAFPTRVTVVHDGSGSVDLVTNIGYDGNQQVASLQDPGGSFRYFTYDTFGRLRQVKNNAGSVVKAYGYVYSATSANGWTFQPTSPNAVIDTTFLQQTPTVQFVASTGFVDGLGAPLQTVVQDGTNYYVTATQYDAARRPWRKWKAYPRTTAGYDPSFATNATNYYTTYHGTTATPYSETQYRADASNRVAKVVPEYLGSTPSVWTLTSYDVDPAGKRAILEFADELGKKIRRYTDIFGNIVQSVAGNGAPEAATTQMAYNVVGRRTQLTDPRGLITTYALNTRGLLVSRTGPDDGTVNSKYDRAGNLRYTQNANQSPAGQVAFTTYDFAGRALTSGLGTATWSMLDPDAGTPPTLETTQSNWLAVRAYDAKPLTSAFPWTLFSSQIGPLTLTNVSGRLAANADRSNGAWQVTLFSYDADGQVATRYTYTQANGGASVLTALNTTDAFTRDLRGELTQRSVTVGTSTFYQWYDYDGRGLLWKTYASISAFKPATPDATDTYGPTAQVKDYQFQSGPLVPITYTVRGQTRFVGDPASTTYPFSAHYAYLANGVVDTAEFYNAGSPAAQKRYRYVFLSAGYDALNRLKSADFSSWSGTAWTTTLAYDLAGINYDASGNLLSLQRYRETGTLIDNLTYTNASTSDRLTSIADAVAPTAETWDVESGSFTYDANGNITSAPAPYSITAVTYDPRNLPISITRVDTTTNYRYDDGGQRITKQVGTGNTEVYLREASNVIAVFTVDGTGTPVSSYFNILWETRVIGRHTNTAVRTYYHTDMLGSTRAVVLSTTGAVVESYDFEPWGLLMPGRTLAGPTKEGFGGKEQDVESGMDYFGARYYLPALGRWASVDPAMDAMPGWSPYNYVYDNPVLHVDPDGKQVDVKETNAYWEQTAIEGHQKGGIRGNVQAGFATVMSTVVEFGGLNLMDQGTDEIADGQIAKGVFHTTLGVLSLMPMPGPKGTGSAVRSTESIAVEVGEAASRGGRGVWSLDNFTRGRAIEDAVSKALGLKQFAVHNVPVIDAFEHGVATSIKSIDLAASSYQSGGRLLRTLNGYVDALKEFKGGFSWGTERVGAVTSRQLVLAVPEGITLSASQAKALAAAISRAQEMGVDIIIQEIH